MDPLAILRKTTIVSLYLSFIIFPIIFANKVCESFSLENQNNKLEKDAYDTYESNLKMNTNKVVIKKDEELPNHDCKREVIHHESAIASNVNSISITDGSILTDAKQEDSSNIFSYMLNIDVDKNIYYFKAFCAIILSAVVSERNILNIGVI